MSSKIFKDEKIWMINNFPIHVELYDSEIIVKDENGNSMRISKKDPLSVILNLNGNFTAN